MRCRICDNTGIRGVFGPRGVGLFTQNCDHQCWLTGSSYLESDDDSVDPDDDDEHRSKHRLSCEGIFQGTCFAGQRKSDRVAAAAPIWRAVENPHDKSKLSRLSDGDSASRSRFLKEMMRKGQVDEVLHALDELGKRSSDDRGAVTVATSLWKSSSSTLQVQQAAAKCLWNLGVHAPLGQIRLTDVVYDYASFKHHQLDGVFVLAQTTVENDSEVEQEHSRTISENVCETTTWSTQTGCQLSLGTQISCHVPMIAGGSVQANAQGNLVQVCGGSTVQTKTITETVKVKVPPRSKIHCSLVGSKSKVSVPYVAKAVATRRCTPDGMSDVVFNVSGTFENISCTDISVQHKQLAVND